MMGRQDGKMLGRHSWRQLGEIHGLAGLMWSGVYGLRGIGFRGLALGKMLSLDWYCRLPTTVPQNTLGLDTYDRFCYVVGPLVAPIRIL